MVRRVLLARSLSPLVAVLLLAAFPAGAQEPPLPSRLVTILGGVPN